MATWLTILLLLLTALYIVVRLLKPLPVRLSRYELERRANDGDERALLLRSRLEASPFLWSVWWFLGIVLIVAITACMVGLLGGSGVPVTILLVLAVAWIEHWPFARAKAKRLYERIEPKLIALYIRRRFLAFLPKNKLAPPAKISSEAELLHTLDGASFLEPERRALIHSALEFTGLTVADAMSGRRSITSVDTSEVLGPLVIDELYKTGKPAFVVTDGDLDNVVGILKLERLTNLDLQDSPPALKMMTPEVHFIDEATPVTEALQYLRSSKAPFLVVQQDGRTTGLLGMDNILRCLFER